MSTGSDPFELASGLSVISDPEAARADDVRQLTGNLTVGVRLWSSATAFVFMSFVFAFLYLKAVNSNGLWRPHGVAPVQSFGIAVLVLTAAATLAFDRGRRELSGGREPAWRRGAILALGLGVLVVIAQGLEYATISFRTWQGGWAAVFWGWTLVQLLFWLGGLYWMETLVAQTLRRPPAAAREGSAGSEMLRPHADACVVFLTTMTGVALLAYVLLYIVR